MTYSITPAHMEYACSHVYAYTQFLIYELKGRTSYGNMVFNILGTIQFNCGDIEKVRYQADQDLSAKIEKACRQVMTNIHTPDKKYFNYQGKKYAVEVY